MNTMKLKTQLPHIGHWINNSAVSDEARVLPVVNPACAEVLGYVAMADKATVDDAVRAAYVAFPGWRDTQPIRRARIMFKFLALLEEHAERLAKIITDEHGKTQDDALGELQRGIEVVEYACGITELIKGEHSKNVGPQMDSWSQMRPLGVVAGITPFNFPAMVPMWMFPIAIAAGNTFILKPSEQVPGVAVELAELLKQAGLPDGVFNIVNGDKQVVDALLASPYIKAVSFVGSTPVAEYVYRTATAQGKRVQALGGAKNHAVVMPDADLDNACNALMGAAFGSAGERCMAISVLVTVGDDVAEALIKKLIDKINVLKVNAGTVPGAEMGPLISREHLARVTAHIQSAQDEGASIVVDGRALTVKGCESGFFIGATLIDKVTPGMRAYQAEIFGPVLQIVRVRSLEEAINLIEAHEYGNGTCIFTSDGATAKCFTEAVSIGMVGVNVPLPVPVAYQSFGGWKRSLFGDLSIYGPDGVRFYTQRKTITERWPVSEQVKVQFSFPAS